MFTIKGEYYCINGCLKYPISNEKVFNLIHCLASSCIIEEAKYYKIEPDNFNYDKAMAGFFHEDKRHDFLVKADFPYTFISLDFQSFNMPCRLILEYLDNDYYRISLLFSSDVTTLDSVRERIIIPFYRFVNPIYGNNGIEKAIFSLNQIDVTDSDIFNSQFMLNYEICEKIGIKCFEKASGIIPIKDVGIYFPQQNTKIFESIFHEFLKSVN